MKPGISQWAQTVGAERPASLAWPLNIVILALAVSLPAWAQEPSQPTESVAEAARAARDQKASTSKQAKVITTDDLVPPASLPPESASPEAPSKPSSKTAVSKTNAGQSTPSAPSGATAATSQRDEATEKTSCDNPDDERLKAELQSLQEEREQLRRELNADPAVISGGNVDMTNFKPGNSGVAFGSPPLSDSQPQSPARIQEVELNERIASLERATKTACDSPEDAEIQRKIDDAEQQLKWLQRQFDLDSNVYYSKPNYGNDTAGKAHLDDEQQQISDVQSEVDRLKQEKNAQPPQ
jgi:hypothetical protein